jgi:serine/threonine protein kinase
MLVVANALQKQKDSYDRRKKVGANSASDIWSLGCLLFELITGATVTRTHAHTHTTHTTHSRCCVVALVIGQFLFYDNDWVRFFIRVTSPGQELINAEKKAMINHNAILLDLLEFILFRNPNMRPTINDVINRFQMVKSVLVSGVKKTHATYV